MNRKLWENLASLYSIQLLNYVLPLLTLPYLTRVLGPGPWGVLAFADAFANYISLLIEYGFGLSATREIAQFREDRLARARHVAGVLGAQVMLASGAAGLAFLVLNVGHLFAVYRPLIPYALVLAVSRSLVPYWYFQGMERMRVVAVLTIAANSIASAATFVFVRSPEDNWLPLALRAGAALLALTAALVLAYRDLPVVMPVWRDSWRVLRQGSSLFFFKSSVSLYTTANVLLLGLISTPAAVAWYAGAEKIARAVVTGLGPITQTFYPRIAHLMAHDRREAMRTGQFSVWLTIGAGTLGGICLFVASPWLVHSLLGRGFDNSIAVLRLFSVLPPVIAGSNVLGIQWMLPLRLDRELTLIVLGAGALNITLALLLAPHYQQMGMAASVVIAEALITASTIVVLRRRKLAPWTAVSEVEGVTA